MLSVPLSGCSCPVSILNNVVLPAPLGADNADDAAGRQFEVQVLELQLVAIRFRNAFGFDNARAETLRNRDEDLRRTGALLLRFREQFFIGVDARLRLRLTRLR